MDESDRISLREFVVKIIDERDRQYQQRFEAQERSVASALEAARTALNKAETATEKRFDSINEFRATLRDQQQAFIPRSELDVRFKRLDDRVDELLGVIKEKVGEKEGGHAVWGFIVGIGGVVTAAVALLTGFFRHSGG